ncbi:hypothetical protein [Anaplasma ovis]|nr:hypothetical protein [Anaplasma ovis]
MMVVVTQPSNPRTEIGAIKDALAGSAGVALKDAATPPHFS